MAWLNFMKRKSAPSSVPEEATMEELNVFSLSHRKQSAVPLTAERAGGILHLSSTYPLALVLRLRVLQIVSGISAMVMGSVAFIEERQKFNLGLGLPAGGVCVLAAAVSIHTSKGVSTKRRRASESAAYVLWIISTFLLLVLLVQCARTIFVPDMEVIDDTEHQYFRPSPRDLTIIACVQILLAITTLISAAICIRIDYTSVG